MHERFSDAELAERLRDADDPDAFETLCLRWRPRLRGYFNALLGDRAASDDAVQEVLLRLWILRRRYRAYGRFEAYMLTLARHHGLNLRRAAERRASAPVPAPAAGPARVDVAEARRAAARLPVGQRQAWELAAAGLPQADIAARLRVPVGTVKSRLHHARRRLRALLEESDG